MSTPGVVVCSFYTPDDYYRSHADRLRATLEALNVGHDLHEVNKGPDDDWADMTRRKIGILHQACLDHPDDRVFWIDVDCSLDFLPDYIANFSADIIGFARGFSNPLGIGYANRTRFWEPCFFGINATPGGRGYIAKAAEFESTMDIKATDDYFFEEAWRSNAVSMSFQIIPSAAVVGRGLDLPDVKPFFRFGSSGKVSEFKDKVVQHQGFGAPAKKSPKEAAVSYARSAARSVYKRIPTDYAQRLRTLSDRVGLTHLLTNSDPLFGQGMAGQGSPARRKATRFMVAAGQRGEQGDVETFYAQITADGPATTAEKASYTAASTFAQYRRADSPTDPITLAWWPRPFPGNFGDWLSPYIVSEMSGRGIVYKTPSARLADPHLVAVGSIGRFALPSSVVVGTGISDADTELAPTATYLSVRGPITAEALRRSGGPRVDSFGDPGALISRLLPVSRASGTNGKVALVRHFKHAELPLILPEGVDELSVLAGSPADIEKFVVSLAAYDSVVTSAMHVLIACQSYGIPCALITFMGSEDAVHGTGIKYTDYARGIGMDTELTPVPVGFDLRNEDFASITTDITTPAEKLDEIEAAMKAGINRLLERRVG